jgi:cell wall assembly regulator SMI1
MIDQLLRDLTAKIVNRDQLHGASESDIASLEREFGVQFPADYKMFLRSAGRGAGEFLKSDHWFFTIDSLPEINSAARRLLDAAGFEGQWFSFATRMGEVYLFLMADGSNSNPPVYIWSEWTDTHIEKYFDSFCDWLNEVSRDKSFW